MIPSQINELIKTMNSSIDDFMSDIPATQKRSFDKLLELVKELDVQNGSISNNLNNIKLLSKIKNEMDNILLNKPYLKKVANFTKAYDKVAQLNNDYYATLTNRFKVGPVLNALKQLNIQTTIDQLTENGLAKKYSDDIFQILKTNITSGASYSDMIGQVRDAIIGKDGEDGRLVTYAKQITTDAIHQYNAQYNKSITDDLGFDWFAYVGALMQTSRPFCIHLEERIYFHRSEIAGFLDGKVDGDSVPLSKSTGLPAGMIPGTNEDTFLVNRGGYNCNHVTYPVPEYAVPKEIVKKVLG